MTNDNFIECGDAKTAVAASMLQKALGEETLFVLVALVPGPDGNSWCPKIARNITKADLQHVLTYLNSYIGSLPE